MKQDRITSLISYLQETKRVFQKNIDEIDNNITLLLELRDSNYSESEDADGMLYYIEDRSILQYAKMGRTCDDNIDNLKHRYKTYWVDVNVREFVKVRNYKEAERVLLERLREKNLLWCQREGNENAGKELVSKTHDTKQIFDSVVEEYKF